ncbi:hypothetical protein COV42_01825 [Candidatus Campbellbacteria bacterium CG11_big_fil_rev_8_21_14_0_20_44_21]|uniref:Serine protease n=1 Tax=Candidatus Campbellbacteria bacterium CG22_combo_CG10-13_8_21_14_all_43_18 TaxID=1974530 RepID=A0A2H0DYB0_9BACT|nr:MAG: hypothetical protein COW82_01290 [Candidatus Campbellbacteria bacterium CG22_combo_CG10-13_8_21_14_all_43_18]PIR24245.1 MAG: hypothetical protein COV42_01825 [Candidatus Campbellbacteria bacterium CG11_big_fil_rev_8_21_14_0_20_44_21]
MTEILRGVVAVFVGIISLFATFINFSPEKTIPPEIPEREGALQERRAEEEKKDERATKAPETEKQITAEKNNFPAEERISPAEVLTETAPGQNSSAEIIPVDLKPEFIDLIITIPPIAKEEVFSVAKVNTLARDALVNIICTTRQSGILQPITGSGTIIDPRGVILTNAHIAQYYLLKDYIAEDFLDCNIRTGSPARNAYKAELLYISPAWVGENYQKIAESNPKGTGENDFALLLIKEGAQAKTPLPASFSYVSPDIRDNKPEVGESLIVAGYPAGFLGGQTIVKELYAVSTVAQVMNVFTFKENTLDLFSVGGNIAAQKGSSGGSVVSLGGRLSGIVVTASEAKETESRDLRAITLSHINKSLEKETGADLNGYLFGHLEEKARQFNELFSPGLSFLLEEALSQ